MKNKNLSKEIYDENDNPPRCPSCKIPYIQHLGLIGTCEKLLKVEKRIKKLEEIIIKMKNDVTNFNV